jgi:hypothetical protein
MHILQADGNAGLITNWKIVPGIKMMYNLEVAYDHTFTVGAGRWVVHNLCGSDVNFETSQVQHEYDRHPEVSLQWHF